MMKAMFGLGGCASMFRAKVPATPVIQARHERAASFPPNDAWPTLRASRENYWGPARLKDVDQVPGAGLH